MDPLQVAGRSVIELRVQGRKLLGTVIRYGAPGEGGMERFQAGAFASQLGQEPGLGTDVMLNVQHQRARPLARFPGNMVLTDSADALTMEARLLETRDADDVLAMVRAGVLVGLSVGFVALSERWENDVRIVERATLDHVAVVDRPSYPDSMVDARSGLRFWQLPGRGYDPAYVSGRTARWRQANRPRHAVYRVRQWL